MNSDPRISPAPAPDVRQAIELALSSAAQEATASAARSAWWHEGLAEQREAGSTSPLERAPSPNRAARHPST